MVPQLGGVMQLKESAWCSFLGHGCSSGRGFQRGDCNLLPKIIPKRPLPLCTSVPHSRLLETAKPASKSRDKKTKPSQILIAEEKGAARKELDASIAKEAHKYFDQVTITTRGGDGGDGAVLKLQAPKEDDKDPRKKTGRKKKGFRRAPDGSWLLPMGGAGGDVVIVADEFVDTLLDLHSKKRHNARRGGPVDSSPGMSHAIADGSPAPTLRLSVPVGTVVKRKRGGKLLADLAQHGEEVLVARGGRGGISILEVPKSVARKGKLPNAPIMSDPDDKELTLGTSGEEVALELTLRVVADVGLVGFPNAGKSSLLAAVTAAKPAIADYPFTTLMPNLGRIDGDPNDSDAGFAMGATMADMPGLIEGAHLGRGLGRMFLRHLRRTRLLVHVVDAAAKDPVQDYLTLREELRMYNPEYVQRPHVVALNKLDLLPAAERFESLRLEILNAAVLPTSGDGILQREGVEDDMNAESSLDPRRSSEKPTGEETAGTASGGKAESAEGSRVSPAKAERVRRGSEKSTERSKGGSRGVGSVGGRRNGAARVEEDLAAGAALPRPPLAVLGISAKEGRGVKDLLQHIRYALKEDDEYQNRVNAGPAEEKRQFLGGPSWEV